MWLNERGLSFLDPASLVLDSSHPSNGPDLLTGWMFQEAVTKADWRRTGKLGAEQESCKIGLGFFEHQKSGFLYPLTLQVNTLYADRVLCS